MDGWELDPWPGALESGIQLKESEILLSIGIRNPVEHFPHVETFFCSVKCTRLPATSPNGETSPLVTEGPVKLTERLK